MNADYRIEIRVTKAYLDDVALIAEEYDLKQSAAVRKAIHDLAATIRNRPRRPVR